MLEQEVVLTEVLTSTLTEVLTSTRWYDFAMVGSQLCGSTEHQITTGHYVTSITHACLSLSPVSS